MIWITLLIPRLLWRTDFEEYLILRQNKNLPGHTPMRRPQHFDESAASPACRLWSWHGTGEIAADYLGVVPHTP
jgi:hypothetical protein